MKAYTYASDKKLAVIESTMPRVHEDTVVVKVLCAAICGTDLRTYRFGSERIVPPRIIGHEACGVIIEAGERVQGFTAGQRVSIVPAVGCGVCRWCKKGITNMCENLKTIGFDYDGAFAEYMEVPAHAIAMGNLLKLEETIETEQATIAEPVACCLNGQSFLKIGEEDTVFIFGAGFIGCVHAELAQMQKAKQVVLSDISDQRLAAAKDIFPRLVTFNTAKEDVAGFVRELTSGNGADVVITACPSGDAHASALQIAAIRGRISLFGGIPGEGSGYLNSNTIHYKELSVFGSHASTVAQNKQILSWVSRGELDLKKYISGSFPLQRIEAGFESLKSERMLKVLIKP